MEKIKRLFKDEEGATMVEYALMLALIAVVCILVVTAVGKKTGGVFDSAQKELGPADQVTPTE